MHLITSLTLSRTIRVALFTLFAAGFAAPLSGQHTGHAPDTAKRATKPAATPKKQTAVKKAASTPAKKRATAAKSATTATKRARAKRAATTTKRTPQRAAPAEMPAMSDSAHAAHMRDSVQRKMTDSAHAKMTDSARARMHQAVPTHDSAHGKAEPHVPAVHTRAPTPPLGRVGGGTISDAHAGPGMAMMTSPLGISMERMGSGTTWIPDAVTLPSRHLMLGSWDVMFHGFVFLQYDKQNGPRGDEQFGSLNWGMLMVSHKLAGGLFQARTMLSLDPWTVSERGYPLLLQSGESYRGQPLHDRQHPHDFWMELGVLYERPISRSLGVSFYAAPSGEPALGPVAFMHRPSAMDNLAAPLSHHWQDATHTSYGVLTAGLFSRKWKIEASAFNGREPDEERWNFDPIRIDSYSGRLTVNPDSAWSLAAGYGYLKSPEALEPEESMHRIMGSILHGAKIGVEGQIASALVYGGNSHGGEDLSHSIVAETEAVLDRANTVFARAELVQKSAADLALDQGPVFPSPLPTFGEDTHFNIAQASLGYIREVWQGRGATFGLGAAGTVNFVPSALEGYYGSRTPLGAFLFLRLRPYYPKRGAMHSTPEHRGH